MTLNLRRPPSWALFLVVAALTVTAPRAGYAQCEVAGQPEAAAEAAILAQTAAVAGMTAAVVAAVETTTTLARAAINVGLDAGWMLLQERLGEYWKDQQKALKAQAAQLSASQLDQTRQLGSINDAAMMNEAARRIQRIEYDMRREMVPTEEGCRFDTAATYMNQAMTLTRSVAAGGANDATAAISNRKDTPAARGPAADNADRIVRTRKMFCNKAANGGENGCLADGGAFADAHVLPAVTIFGAPTLDFSDERTLPAVNDLARNIVGYEVAQPVRGEDLKTAGGKQERMYKREVTAQMDAVAGLVWGIAGERVPSEAAPEIEDLRMYLGAQASKTPSEYELRKQTVEQLWSPAYYVGLQDTTGAVSQKQLYLRAYSVMQLYKLIERMEKISTVYAIQTSNLLERRGRGLDETPTGSSATPGGNPP